MDRSVLMTTRVSLVLLALAGGCGFPTLPGLSGDASPGGDARSDAPIDAPAILSVAASPSSFLLHAKDARDTVITVTNGTGQTVGVPELAVTGLTLGTMMFPANTNLCTESLAPGQSCTAIGNLVATTAGEIQFQLTATSNPGGSAMATLPMTVMPACPTTCGPSGNSNCCASSVVPGNAAGAMLAGATFYRGHDAAADTAYKDMTKPATVSDFRLDTYEVSVGRFRAFVNAGRGTQQDPPAAGAGAHAKISGSGWDSSWNASLAADTNALKAAVKCSATYQTWTDTAGANEALPINCLTWFEAMAFCIWDGGYLPTEAEWQYAASGGSEQRSYPWSNPASSLAADCSYANYNIQQPTGTYCTNGTTGATNRVGSESPKGDGKWGQSDLGGNVFEWILDWSNSTYPTPCNDCANLNAASGRVLHGGSFYELQHDMRTGMRYGIVPTSRLFTVGLRCARTP
jgi:formylglycine-generating enzyme